MEQDLTAAANTLSATERPAADATKAASYVIAVGASAGGLEAITEFFDHVPAHTNASFIIIQHLSPDHKSLMAELLAKHTPLTITQAEEGMLLKPNCIYLIPNRNTMTLRHGRLRLAEKPLHKAPNLAIDIFFTSLAHDQGPLSIGIVLSGTGSDGTRGLEAIKLAGGLVLVQEPSSASFDGMPNSAIATGLADAVLPPKEMPEVIGQYLSAAPHVKGTYLIPAPEKVTDENQLLEEILTYTKSSGGLDFTAYKRPTLTRRVAKRMLINNVKTYDSYLELLKDSPDEVKQLCNEFLINVTHFFRDERAFALLEEKVIPAIVHKKSVDDPIKIWVAGCSTGEEPYSLAMLLDIYLNKHQIYRTVKIFATDIDKEVVQFASKGIYPASVAPSLPPQILSQYFVRRSEDFVICEHIRKMVIFAHHDVSKDAPFSKVDLISCRNMLIYMNTSLQHKVLSAFHFALNVGGYLFLGPSENLGKLSACFSEISRKWKLYKNIEASRKTLMQHVTVRSLNINPRVPETMPVRKSRPNLQNNIGDIFNATLVEEYSYAGVCIDENFRVLHAIGNYKKYLDLPDWQLNLNLNKMVPEEVALVLSAAVRKVIKTNQKTILPQVKLNQDGSLRFVDIVLKPFMSGEYSEQFVFVLFSENIQQKNRKSAVSEAKYTNQNEQLAALEQELNETKENLFATFQELEVSNEELQSNNEELLSANEELQSTNEELQSLNEELHTVNTEHQQKIKELIELNEDLDNYFRNADIGQMFVDQALTIRKFTPGIVNQINLIPGDIGRPLAHFSNNLKYDYLLEDIQLVIDSGQPLEKEIEIRSGKYFLMRLMPYLKQTNKPDGVVVTFVDVTPLKHLNNTLEGILNSSLNGIMALKAIQNAEKQVTDFEWTLVNEAAGKLLKKEAHLLTGKKLLQELPGFKKSRLFNRLVQVMVTGEPLNTEHYYEHDNLQMWFHIIATRIADGLTVTFADITAKKRADQNLLTAYQEIQVAEENLKKLNSELEERITERTHALSLSEERFRLISLATNDAIWDWSLMNNKLWWNEGFKTMFAYTSEQIEPGVESWFKRIHPDDKDRIINSVNEAIDSNQEQWSGEYRFRKADGSYAYVVNRAFILHTENQIPYRMLGSLIDLTNLKTAQEELRKTNSDLVRINNDLDNFVYTASHDLKSPISNIEGLLYHLELELENADDHITEILSHIKKSVDRFQTTIKDLTEISKVNKLEENDVTDVNIAELLDDIKISIHSMIAESAATIQMDCQKCPEIKFSKKNLRSILYNLVNNSVKYRDDSRPLVIKISTEKTPEYAVLTVQDNGLGINEAQQPKLFSMFKRFHNHVEGSGVGLYILNKIVDNAQGKIEVESKVGVGTTFRIYLKHPANN